MKTKVKLSIFLLLGLTSLVYVFPFVCVEAAKLESGVTIKEAAPPPAGTCPDANGDGLNDATLATCVPPAGPAAGTCGLQIVSGVPINYGQLNPGQGSAEQRVIIKPEGLGKIMVKGGDWISDAAGNPTISGPELTHVSDTTFGITSPQLFIPQLYYMHKPLTSNGSQVGLADGRDTYSIYFQLYIPNSFSGFGSLHQEVTIDLLC